MRRLRGAVGLRFADYVMQLYIIIKPKTYYKIMKSMKMLSLIAATAILSIVGCKNDNSELAHHHHDHEQHEHGAHEGHNEHEHEHEGHDHEGHDEHEHEHEAHGGDVITLEPATAERFGVHAVEVAERPFGDVIKVSGTVALSSQGSAVVTAPTSGIVTLGHGITVGSTIGRGATVATVKAGSVAGSTANEVALAEMNSARAELDRLTPLFEKRLVTQARYNEAKASYERAKAAYSAPASAGRASAPAAGTITSLEVASGQYVEAGQPIATVSSSTGLNIRADVPARYSHSLASINDARIVVASTGDSFTVSETGGRRISATTAGAASGYVPVTFDIPATDRVVPGEAVEVYLTDGKSTRNVITVPRSALYEQQGDYCVFVQLDEDCYRKVPVVVGGNNGIDVAILSGLKAGDMVVDRGVTTVRLAAASGAIPAGHSHQH